MKAAAIIYELEQFAPLTYQESYDNCGIQVGDAQMEVVGILLTLDVTEAVIEEAIARNCNMIIAHHPLIFSGIKKITGKNYVERIIIKAIQNNLLIYAAHTNMDNMQEGVNALIAKKLGVVQGRILAPMEGLLYKLQTYVPLSHVQQVQRALFQAGAGHIGRYEECSFISSGTGTFKPMEGSQPAIGSSGGPMETVAEEKLEVLVAKHQISAVLHALRSSHLYEEVAYELIPLLNQHQHIGAGLVGKLATPMDETAFLTLLKNNMQVPCIRHTAFLGKPIETVAICGGSGSFLLPQAIGAKADILVTADFKYHQFFDAADKIVIADIGHYESEQYTPEIFMTIIQKKFPNFAVLLSNTNTNPVKYFI